MFDASNLRIGVYPLYLYSQLFCRSYYFCSSAFVLYARCIQDANSAEVDIHLDLLATLSIFLKPLSHISQFNYVKLATSYYFLFFDKENYLEMAISSDSQKNEKPEAKNRMTVLLTNTLNYCKNEPFTARK